MIRQRIKGLSLAVAASLALAGCFGGGGDDETVPMPVDPLAAVRDTALQTAAGTVDYQQLLNSPPARPARRSTSAWCSCRPARPPSRR